MIESSTGVQLLRPHYVLATIQCYYIVWLLGVHDY